MTIEKFSEICANIPNLKIIDYWVDESYNGHQPFINFILKKIDNL